MAILSSMSRMLGGSSMLRTRRQDTNLKPNRKLDRKSSRGVLYENEELRLRTININAEIDKGQSDIKKLKRENEQLRKEIAILRNEYDRLEELLKRTRNGDTTSPLHQAVHADDSDTSDHVKCVCDTCAANEDTIDKPLDVLVIEDLIPPPQDFIVQPFQNGGNVQQLLESLNTGKSYMQKNVIMCTKKSLKKYKCPDVQNSYVTEKCIDLNYDYPKLNVKHQHEETTDIKQTVLWVEQKVPIRVKPKWGFLFRSRSVPVGETDEPIYATVKKLPRRVRNIDVEKLEKETGITTPIDTEESDSKETIIENKKRKRFSFRFKRRLITPKTPISNSELTKNECSESPITPDNQYMKNGINPLRYRDVSSSDRERTNSSSPGSCHSRTSIRIAPQASTSSIPWCACWGAGCL